MIEFVNVTKKFSYRGHPIAAVSELTMSVPDGGIVALVGPNGAGKTTVLRMLTTVMKPTEGRITVQGFDTRTRAQAVRKMIGYVPQSGSVTTGSRVREELVFHGALMGMTAAKARARANELIENFDLREQAERQIQQLSGGQRRRVNLALALMHWPQVVIFDEPTVGLDPLSRAHLWESIHALRESFGITVVMSTHYLEEAAALADQIVLIDHGTMIAADTPEVTSYDIFVPGLLVQLVLFGAAFSGLSTVTEWRSGELERVLATPAPRIALLGGRVLRDVVVMIIQSILLIAAAFTLGVRHNIGTLALMLVLVGVLTVAIASMSYLFALTAKSEQALAQLANGILLPVTLLAGIMLPMSVAPQWLRSVSRFNPLTYIVDAARSLFDPTQPAWHTWLGFAVATVLAVALFFLAHRKMSSDNQ